MLKNLRNGLDLKSAQVKDSFLLIKQSSSIYSIIYGGLYLTIKMD